MTILRKKEDFINYVYDYEYNKIGIPEPDLVIFLHVPFELARSLKNKKGLITRELKMIFMRVTMNI